ncbi:hypothetical protein [Phaeobacter sp. CECT 5382]|uniref:hypothetical protein n=1 Tax=Phaeobacter sp. CECT 5382 TaxID=1712645 RepID=UPI0012E39EEB|nr:hypothetical protein [Phaeobacter sp. CECT 5382]
MKHNVDFGAEAQANHALAVLRAQNLDCQPADAKRFSPGIFLSIDPESDSRAHVTSTAGELLNLEMTTERPGRWLSLNIELGSCDLSQRDVMGFVCKTRADETITFQACLRSGQDKGFQDAFFGKRVISYSGPSTHADLVKLEERDDIPPQAPWRELILFFPPDLRQLTLIDLSLFGV